MLEKEEDETQYIKYSKRIIELCKRAGIQKYNSKYSNKLYDNYQHITLQCIRQYEQKGYKRFAEDLPDKAKFLEFLKLEVLPHYTALQKFAKRIKQTVLELVLVMSLARTGIKKVVGGVDGTGNRANRASFYYVYRLESFARKSKKKKRGRPKKKRKVRRFIKAFPFVELRTQISIAALFSRRQGSEAPYFEPVAKKAMKCGKPFKEIPLDMGYDAEHVHEFIREEMNALSIIPARNEDVPVWRTQGRYRKQMKRGYSKKKYHQRSKNESVNYVVKQLMGDCVYALDWRLQNKELMFRYIMYGVYRFDKIKKNIFLFIVLLVENTYFDGKKSISEVNRV